MKLLDDFLALQKQIHDYFGYIEDWRVIPIDDAREYFWREDGNSVRFSGNKGVLDNPEEDYYENEIYKQRHLTKWVYRAKDYTMICVDTKTDLNKFLQIFDNSKEQKKCP